MLAQSEPYQWSLSSSHLPPEVEGDTHGDSRGPTLVQSVTLTCHSEARLVRVSGCVEARVSEDIHG